MAKQKHSVIIAREAALVRQCFPQFSIQYIKRVPTWFGTLQPRDESPLYRVKINYSEWSVPKVWVVSPRLESNAPHRYADKSLCLYYPEDKSWHENARIATHIIPWTAEWLFFYECWLDKGVWYGLEAPHQLPISPSEV